jgi:hypothetical protein
VNIGKVDIHPGIFTFALQKHHVHLPHNTCPPRLE